MPFFINYPTWLHPEIIQGLPFRWYGVMYMIAFLLSYLLFKKQVKEKNLDYSEDTITNLFFWAILGVLIGGRIFSTLFYDQSGKYWMNPLLIFWPFDKNFNFTGLQGMSYHGGLLGVITAVFIYCKKKKISILETGDMFAAAAPAGYTFGRLGNFINGELFGRVTSSPIGIVFPDAPSFPIKEEWVLETALKAGIDVSTVGEYVNLPRHPSQLYEALFEGVLLYLFLWFFMRKRKLPKGTLIGSYIAGYGLVRFFIEYFREPDQDIGFILSLTSKPGYVYRLDSLLHFSQGQLLCFFMIAGGLLFIFFLKKNERKKTAEEEIRGNRIKKGLKDLRKKK
ncbi:MAG: prolipoprotein diacylglyceryl transferase [Spirochaetia bacterium]|jgi:phosphatidylglycerol:prolipoprotein diacylglycerol transferase|nr:prolipoprotein diacylglyceryl transferase [Spirochaetia bacterium]